MAVAVTAVSPWLWCCQAFRGRMESLAEQWRDLHARRAQLKAHVVTSGSTVKVPLAHLAHLGLLAHLARCPCSATVSTLGKSPGSALPAKPPLRMEL